MSSTLPGMQGDGDMSTDKYWLDRRKVKLWLIRRNVKKFWEIELAENSYTVVAGLDGTEGRTTTKKFACKVEVKKAYLQAIATAFMRGYREEQLPGVWQAFADWNVTAVGEFLRADPELAKFRGPQGDERQGSGEVTREARTPTRGAETELHRAHVVLVRPVKFVDGQAQRRFVGLGRRNRLAPGTVPITVQNPTFAAGRTLSGSQSLRLVNLLSSTSGVSYHSP